MEVVLLCILNCFMRQSFGTGIETKRKSVRGVEKATKPRHRQIKYQENKPRLQLLWLIRWRKQMQSLTKTTSYNNYQKEQVAFKLNYLNDKKSQHIHGKNFQDYPEW